jgi:hypothetical protein
VNENRVKSFYRPKVPGNTGALLSRPGIDEIDNRYGRIMELISFLKPDEINSPHSVTALISEITEQKKI